jgi:hypothetical protein
VRKKVCTFRHGGDLIQCKKKRKKKKEEEEVSQNNNVLLGRAMAQVFTRKVGREEAVVARKRLLIVVVG